MDGGTHVIFAVAKQLLIAHYTGLGPGETTASLILVANTSAGRGSPDMDNFPWWRKSDKHIKDEALGCGGPLRHRGITHWWFWPCLAALLAHQADLGDVGWVIWALILGWTSHLIGDFLFGIAPHGIPLWPWWGHVGLGMDSGGWFEHRIVPLFLAAAVWWTLGHPGATLIANQVAAWTASR